MKWDNFARIGKKTGARSKSSQRIFRFKGNLTFTSRKKSQYGQFSLWYLSIGEKSSIFHLSSISKGILLFSTYVMAHIPNPASNSQSLFTQSYRILVTELNLFHFTSSLVFTLTIDLRINSHSI